jgi:hypothetical protein
VRILDQASVVAVTSPRDASFAMLERRAEALGYHRCRLAEHYSVRTFADLIAFLGGRCSPTSILL